MLFSNSESSNDPGSTVAPLVCDVVAVRSLTSSFRSVGSLQRHAIS